MRIKTVTPIFAAAILLTSCSAGEREQAPDAPAMADAVMEAPEEGGVRAKIDLENSDASGADAAAPSGEIKIAAKPQIAYKYSYGYRVGAKKIPILQKAHADLCEKKGPQVCRILNMSQSGGEGDYASGRLEIEVAADKARGFGGELAKLAENSGGEQIDTSISGEDLSKQIVDTQARLRARIVLRDRLMEILKNRSGKVSELVEAERGVAAVNEEIDQAQSWLAEMKGRVAFSKMTLGYNSGYPAAGGFFEPIRNVVGSAGGLLGSAIAFLIGAVIVLLPFALILWLLLWSRHRHGWRFRFWKKQRGIQTAQDDEES